MKPKTLTATQAAKKTGYGLFYLYALLRSGKLKGENIGGQWQIPESALEDLPRMQKNKTGSGR
jgi:excisionase family DNA binding protein